MGPSGSPRSSQDGRVMRWGVDDDAPTDVFNRAPWYRDAAWLSRCFRRRSLSLALTALSWPAAAIARRRYGASIRSTARISWPIDCSEGFAC